MGSSCKSRLLRDQVPEHGVEDEQQLAHGCDHDHLPGFPLPAQAGVEVADGGIASRGGHRDHAGDFVLGGAAAPDAARVSLLSAVPVRERHQRCFATASQLHNSAAVVPQPEQPGTETPRQAETEEGLHEYREIQIQGMPTISSVQYADKTLLIPAAMASQSSGAHH